jgi:hypothetical protein
MEQRFERQTNQEVGSLVGAPEIAGRLDELQSAQEPIPQTNRLRVNPYYRSSEDVTSATWLDPGEIPAFDWRERFPAIGAIERAVVIILFVVVPLHEVIQALFNSSRDANFFFLCTLFWTVAVSIFSSIRVVQSKPAVKFQRLVPTDGQKSPMVVKIALERGGVIYGEDHGYLRFIEHSLYFEGLRTIFSFSNVAGSHDRRPQSLIERFSKGRMRFGKSECVRFVTDGLTHFMYITPVETGQVHTNELHLLRDRLIRWNRSAAGKGVVDVTPPIDFSPDANLRAKLALWHLSTPISLCFAALVLLYDFALLHETNAGDVGNQFDSITLHFMINLGWIILSAFILAVPLTKAIGRYVACRRRVFSQLKNFD